MRILLVTGTYLPSANGVAVSVSGLKESFTKAGHKVLVVAPKNKGSKQEDGVVRYQSIDNPWISDYPIPLFPGRSIFEKVANFKPEIVHVHHAMHIGYFARLIADKYKIPLVFTFHTDVDRYAQKYAELLPKNLRKWFVENAIYNFCKKVDFLIAPSFFIEKRLQQKMPFIETATVQSPVAGIKRTKMAKVEIIEKLKLPKDKKILVTVSRLGSEKNLKVLIESIKYLSEKYFLVLVGSGPQESYLKKFAKKIGVAKRIKFVGKVIHSQIGEYYKAADYFYYSSVTETQGLVFLEAAYFGKPIVAVDSFAARELLNDSFSQVTKNSALDLAKGVRDIEKRQYPKMAQSSLELVKKFSKEKQSNRLLDIYMDLTERKLLANKVLSTGWQSWSARTNPVIKLPLRNYSPIQDTYLPKFESLEKTQKKQIVGWCSWYAFWRNISEAKIQKQSEWFKENKTPVKYILVDDGWTRWGDWTEINKKKFPGGHAGLTVKIRENHLQPGIWVAPFLVDPRSNLAKKHPEFLATLKGKIVDGFKVTKFDKFYFPRYILDIRKKKVRKFLVNQISKLLDEGRYDLLKLDFLYAAYFIPGISAKEAGYYLHNFLVKIKKKYPKVYTIACGAPLLPIVGAVDSVRIGPDTVLGYMERLPLIPNIINETRVGNVIKNIEKRSWLAKYWNLDPDVFVCRKELGVNSTLLLNLQDAVKNLNGSIFLGDDMTALPQKRIEKYIVPLFK